MGGLVNADICVKAKPWSWRYKRLQAIVVAGVEVGEAAKQTQTEVTKMYQKKLREIIGNASPEEVCEIMSAMATAKLPLWDVGAN